MTITISVKSGSKKGPLVVETSEKSLIIYVRSRAIDGRANTEAIKVLSDYYKLPKSLISIKSGHTSRTKIIEIDA